MILFAIFIGLVIIGLVIYVFYKKKPQKMISLIFITVITLVYFWRVFGFTPSAKFTYNITTTSKYEYISSYNIGNGKSIIISMLENDNSLKKYNLSLYNNKLGLYFKNFTSYEKMLIGVVENKDFEMVCIKFDNIYYYIVDFEASKINYLEINGMAIKTSNLSYNIFELEDEIYSIKIDDYSPNWYIVPIPKDLY